MANKEIDNLTLLIAPSGADVAAAKNNTDYRIRVGEANGLATLDVSAKLTSSQLPALTISSVTGLQTALDGKAALSHTHTFASLTGKPTTLVGYGITDAASSTHTHAAADITSGVFATARLGSGTASASTFLSGTGWQAIVWDDVGSKPTTFTPATHVHAASDITSGTMATARLGSGTASSTTFLSGTGWQTLVTTDISNLSSYTGLDTRYYTETEVNSLLAAKAALASPALTGTPTVPTAAAGTNTTQAASTAFVRANDDPAKANLAGTNTFTGAIIVPTITIGGGEPLTKIQLGTTAPGALADGVLYLRY